MRRVDLIREILNRLDGRARVRDVLAELQRVEGNENILTSAVSVAVSQENKRLEELGELPAFRTSRNGEDWGWISLGQKGSHGSASKVDELQELITQANREVDAKIQERLEKMDWRTFESSFLTEVLLNLGFQDVEITQATRDGGTDAKVSYKRGIVEANAIVSAKRWTPKAAVSVGEVRMLRGIQGPEDTAIIVTTGRFTDEAKREAQPSQNQRIVYLIDGERLVEICKTHGIGVNKLELRKLYVLDEDRFSVDAAEAESEEELAPERQVEPEGPDLAEGHSAGLRRFRESMLAELSYPDIARLTGLTEGSVRTYMSNPARRRDLAARIRANENAKVEALRLVEEERGLR